MQKNYKKIKENIDIIIGLIFIIYFIPLIYLSHLSFKYLFLILGIGFIIYHFVKKKIKEKRKLYKILKRCLLVLLSFFLLVESAIIFYPNKNIKDCDYIIVLGALVNKNKPSKTLEDRLNATIDYINKSEDDDLYIVVSGGKGRGENISEAQAMEDYLIQKNISPNIILKEDKSTTTQENFLYSKDIIEKHSNKKIEDVKIKIITTDFHSLRSSIMAKKYGFKNYSFYTSSSKYYLAPLNYTREFYAIIYYLFKH